MRRKYTLNSFNIDIDPSKFLNLAKSEYIKRYPKEIITDKSPFSHCIVYLVINHDKTIKIDFNYPQNEPLQMNFIHKRPGGAKPNEVIRKIDIREITNIIIPPYKKNFYFDFIFYILDTTTNEYWATNLWTKKVCPDLRYYLSRKRKQQYYKIGLSLAEKYNQTFILGHVNLMTGRLKPSRGIKKLSKHGWIPTISLLPQPFGEMVRIIESTDDMNHANLNAVKLFDSKLLKEILDRWLKTSLVNDRKEILTTVIDRFISKDFISTIYILLPQIEGLITRHIKRKGGIPKEGFEKRIEQFGEIIKAEKYNTKMTHYLTNILIYNLKKTFYKTWYPYSRKGKKFIKSNLTPQRNVTLHGEINPKYFTEESCLKLICIIDSIILLSLRKREIAFSKDH